MNELEDFNQSSQDMELEEVRNVLGYGNDAFADVVAGVELTYVESMEAADEYNQYHTEEVRILITNERTIYLNIILIIVGLLLCP